MVITNGNLDQVNRNGSNPDNFSGINEIQEETQAGVENLRQSTIDSSLSTASAKSDLTIEQTGLKYERDIRTLVGFLSVVDKLLEEIEDTKKGLSTKGLSKAGKKTIKEAKTKLNQYEKQLKGKKNSLINQKNSEIYDNDIANLRNLWQQINKTREDIGAGQRGEYSNIASYLYNSPEIARKSNKHQVDNLEFQQKLQEELKDWAILRIFNGNTQKANDFYRKIAQGQYHEAEYQLFLTNASILTPSFTTNRAGKIEGTSGVPNTSSNYRNLDRGETFQQGGIAGIIDKALSSCNNLTPGQRNTWKSLAVLGGYAAGIYGLYKFFTSDQKRWKKAGITAAAIFGTQVLTGENPFSLFQKAMTGGLSWDDLSSKFGNTFGDAVDGVQSSGIESGNELSGAMYSLMVFNETATVGDVRGRSTKFKNDHNAWTQFRLAAKEKIGAKHFEKFSAVFSENFNENKWNEWLNSIGIHDSIDDNKSVYELASYKTINTIIINKFLSDNGIKVTDEKIKKEEFEQYKKSCNDNNKSIDINVLNNHPERFTKDLEATYTDRLEDKQNIKALEDQVEALSLDSQKKSELKIAIKRFYDERNIDTKPNLSDFSLKMENGLLILSSRKGEKAEINVDTRELKGFGNGDIRFSNLAELLNVADISNKILLTQKGKAPKDLPAFEYKIGKGGRGIYFNDADTLSFNFDTRVLSGGWGGKTGEIKTLGDHPNAYATYLSKRWIENNKINVDAIQYPTVKKLSDSGIDFINQQEIKDLEAWLQEIKEGKKFSVATPDGNPFKISRRFKSLSNKLVFTAVNGDNEVFQEDISSKFPTLMRKGNQKNFIDFMNNPNNKMWGSAL